MTTSSLVPPATPPSVGPHGTAAVTGADPVPVLPPRVPRREAPRFVRRLARWLYVRLGWRVEGAPADAARQVVVIAPHTSNGDFFICALYMLASDLSPRWLGKHTLFRPPLGWLMRAIGGIPVRRDAHHDLVSQVVAEFARSPTVFLAITPEGTRRKASGWKTGYYAIAAGAGVPVVPVWVDWPRRVIGFGPRHAAEGGAAALTERLLAYYRPEMARRPREF